MSPRFSFVTPVYNTPKDVLIECIQSVKAQWFGDWELCLVNDGSSAEYIEPILDNDASSDARIRVHHRAANGGIVARRRMMLWRSRPGRLHRAPRSRRHDRARHVAPRSTTPSPSMTDRSRLLRRGQARRPGESDPSLHQARLVAGAIPPSELSDSYCGRTTKHRFGLGGFRRASTGHRLRPAPSGLRARPGRSTTFVECFTTGE